MKVFKEDRMIIITCGCDRKNCGTGWFGTWREKTARKDEQVLEVCYAYGPKKEACRDYVRLLTYGQMAKDRGEAIQHVSSMEDYNKDKVATIMDWFMETVDKNWAPPLRVRQTLAQYLGEYLQAEVNEGGFTWNGDGRWFKKTLAEGIEAYESTEGKKKPLALHLGEVIRDELKGRYPSPVTRQGWAMVMQLAIDKYEKGITNEEAKAKT